MSSQWELISVEHLDGDFYHELHQYYTHHDRFDGEYKSLTNFVGGLKCPFRKMHICENLRVLFLPLMRLIKYYDNHSDIVLFSNTNDNKLGPLDINTESTFNYFFLNEQFQPAKRTDIVVNNIRSITLGTFYEVWTHSGRRCDFKELNWLLTMVFKVRVIYEDIDNILKIYCAETFNMMDYTTMTDIGLDSINLFTEYRNKPDDRTTTTINKIQNNLRLCSQQDEIMETIIETIKQQTLTYLPEPSFPIVDMDNLLWKSQYITWKNVVNRIPEQLSDGGVCGWINRNFQFWKTYMNYVETHFQTRLFNDCPYTLRDFIIQYKYDINDNYKSLPKLERCVRSYLDMSCYSQLPGNLEQVCMPSWAQ